MTALRPYEVYESYYTFVMNMEPVRQQILEIFDGYQHFINTTRTIEVMLRDAFYGEVGAPGEYSLSVHDHTVVLTQQLPEELIAPMEALMGDFSQVVYLMIDMVRANVLDITPGYQYDFHQCLYNFIPQSNTLMVYLPASPVMPIASMGTVDAKAVIFACYRYLPAPLVNALAAKRT